MAEITHWYLHVDLDAFFASVEQLDHPEYRGKPVIVGGKPEDRRSVVSTASYEARKFGVHSAMPTFQAYKLCPQGIFVHGRMQRYSELSYQIMSIFRDYSPDVQQMSIDEAFIDITGTEKLFGPPEETAMKIKKVVKEKTGLTVSVGLATTKYLAKIASGFSKPDGFHYIHQGQEQAFMLALPLNKVWGLGPKSLELLKSKGFKTTRDIYERDFDTLNFLFGNNMATFLYEVVRGKENSSFSKERKSHSISAETTFPYDLTDVYTIETELLELAHGVFFRLLKENSYSRTAFVKIRYDDFTTCSIQETLDRNIMTLDSYFEIIKKLFEKKYNNSSGIRLLGVGFDNIEKTERPYQQELFENNDSKKQAVEKAILNLEKKHPEIKVRKARTFKSTTLKTILLLSLLLLPAKNYAKENTISQTGAATIAPDTFYEPSDKTTEAPEVLFDYDINDKTKVELSISGFWKTLVSDTLLFSFEEASLPSFAISSPVFKQQVELSASVLLNQHWFFQADFAEEFKKNTIAMGYQSEDVLRLAKISNRGITMAQEYSGEIFGYGLQGGENQAPGIMAHFMSPDERLEADFVLRYDMTESHSATFYGMNQVQDTKIDPSAFLYGYSYKFPAASKEYFLEIADIYVESNQGSYTDSIGRKYKKLSSSDYSYSSLTGLLYLNASANAGRQEKLIPSVIVTFNNSSYVNQIISQTGTYDDVSSFAGAIQKEFNTNSVKKYELKDFTTSPLIYIDERPGLIIQNSTGFSPYVNPSVYDCGLSTEAEVFVINESNELQIQDYIAEKITSGAELYEDFFKEKHLYYSIINRNNPDTAYPFSYISPEIYLNLQSKNNIKIISRSYKPISEYQIGTDACAGTVMVYKNNTLDLSAVYDKNTGIVKLSSAPASTDKIFISWQEDSADYFNGAVSAGAGLKYHFTPELMVDTSITSRWPVSNNSKYSTPDSIQKGFAAFSTGIDYKTENLHISEKASLAVQKDNAAAGLLVYSPSDTSDKTYYLDSSNGYITETEPILSLESKTVILTKEKNGTIKKHNGLSDQNITGYKIPLSWNFNSEKNWASVDIKLEAGDLLRNASQFNFAVQPDISISKTDENSQLKIYLQLGIDAENADSGEDRYNIPCWEIDDLDITKNEWQTLSIHLDDKARAKLTAHTDLRLIVTGSVESGTIYIGPYEPVQKSIQTYQDDSILVTSSTIPNTSKDSTDMITWHLPAGSDISSMDDLSIKSHYYFKQIDFSSYNNIEFEFGIEGFNSEKYSEQNNQWGFQISLEKSEEGFISLSADNTALFIGIKDLSDYFSPFPETHKLKVNLNENKIFLDDYELPQENYTLAINDKIKPDKMILNINTVQGTNLFHSGSFYINKLILTDTDIYTTFQNNISVDYENNKTLIKAGDYELLKNVNAGFSSNQNLGDLKKITPDVSSQLYAGVTFSDLKFKTDAKLNNTKIANIGHNIETDKPIFKIFELQEQYRFNPGDTSLKKSNLLKMNLQEYNIPVSLTFNAAADDFMYTRTQNNSTAAKINFSNGNYGVNFESQIKLNQHLNKLRTPAEVFDLNNYFNGWSNISGFEFSTGEEKADLRSERLETKLEGIFPFLNFKPNIRYSLQGNYNSGSSTTFEDKTSIALILPVKISNTSLGFTLSRNGGKTSSITEGGSYVSDSNKVFTLQQDRLWLYTSIPFYELFAPYLKDGISANYSTQYEFSYKRKLFNNINDVFIPSNVTFAVQRSILSENTVSDLYQYKAVITNTSINNFGSLSQKRIFNWFKQEELITSLSGIVKVPADLPENTTFQVSAYIQLLFLIDNKKTLSTALDYSIDSNIDWATHASVIYSRPGKTSFITTLIDLITRKKLDISITRKDSFTAEISQKERINLQKYYYNHGTDYEFLRYFTITTGIGALFDYTQNKASNFGLEFSIGGKAEF